MSNIIDARNQFIRPIYANENIMEIIDREQRLLKKEVLIDLVEKFLFLSAAGSFMTDQYISETLDAYLDRIEDIEKCW